MKTILKLSVAALAAITLASCCCNKNEPKFSAKEYAQKKTARLNDAVALDKAQEKKVYKLYLGQAKSIEKKMSELKKEECNAKQPACNSCDECTKPCDKAGKPACKEGKPCCDKAAKAECGKECNKPCCKKDCDKAGKPACKEGKPCCDKAAKPECKAGKPECRDMKHCHPRHPFFSPEERQAFLNELNEILTPEQQAKLKEKHASRPACPNIPEQPKQVEATK